MKLLIVCLAICFWAVSPGAISANTQAKDRLSDYADRPPPPASSQALKTMELKLAEARAAYEAKPTDPDAIIWLGRRLAYPGRFREAIEVFTKGIAMYPRDPRFYRHRGHRYITLRRFDLAIADFQQAAKLIKGKPDEVEPDGQPNARNIPTSTLQFNIWYHLGLAYYLTGNYRQALASYRECLKVSKNPDAIVATTHWLYLTLRRLNRPREAMAAIAQTESGMDVIENEGYYRLVQLYQGHLKADDLLREVQAQGASAASHSVLYGIAGWFLINGEATKAIGVLDDILKSEQWTSFGFIAAERDRARLKAPLKS